MNRLKRVFTHKKSDILNIYFTAGHPSIDSLPTIAKSLENAGVDILEIGFPYSDPLADGQTIQNSSETALANGMNLDLLFDQVKTLRSNCEIPIVGMGYLNQIIQYGEERFVQHCVDSGIDGMIVPDLPLDIYQESYQSRFEEANILMSFLVTPQTSDHRIELAANLSQGFLYIVSRSSITGSTEAIKSSQIDYFNRVDRLKGDTPSLIGFGIHDKATYERVCKYSNGAIIGSQFIRTLEKHGYQENVIYRFVDSIRERE